MKQIEKYTIKASIKTTMHISSQEEYDRMDYFIFEDWLQIVNQTWLEDLSKQDEKLFKDILKSIEEGNFKKLEELKSTYYDKYFDADKFELEDIDIWEKAKESLKNTWWKNNQWIIKKQFQNKFTQEAMIPWSTLKWLFRSIYFFDKYWKDYEKHKKDFKLWKIIENSKENKEYFSNLYFEDVNIKNQEKSIQYIIWTNKTSQKTWENKWIPLVVETIKQWDFNIDITNFFKDKNHNLDFDVISFSQAIKDYSNIMIKREKQILDNIWIKSDFIDELNKLYDEWKYPIKIWMFKKSLSYKLYWEDILEDLVYTQYNRKIWKKTMDDKKARNFWVWDKSIYLDENENPMWWIVLEF